MVKLRNKRPKTDAEKKAAEKRAAKKAEAAAKRAAKKAEAAAKKAEAASRKAYDAESRKAYDAESRKAYKKKTTKKKSKRGGNHEWFKFLWGNEHSFDQKKEMNKIREAYYKKQGRPVPDLKPHVSQKERRMRKLSKAEAKYIKLQEKINELKARNTSTRKPRKKGTRDKSKTRKPRRKSTRTRSGTRKPRKKSTRTRSGTRKPRKKSTRTRNSGPRQLRSRKNHVCMYGRGTGADKRCLKPTKAGRESRAAYLAQIASESESDSASASDSEAGPLTSTSYSSRNQMANLLKYY